MPYPGTVWRALPDTSTTHDGVRGYADLPVGLPHGQVDAAEMRHSPEYAELHTEVGRAVKAAAA